MDYGIDQRVSQLKAEGALTWLEIVNTINTEFGTDYTSEGLRTRFKRYRNGSSVFERPSLRSTNVKEIGHDGSIVSRVKTTESIINQIEKVKGNRPKVVKILGYDPLEWELLKFKISQWDQKSKTGDKQLYALQYHVRPYNNDGLSLKEKAKIANAYFKSEIKPIKYNKPKQNKKLNKNKLMELTGIELHLGKLAFEQDTNSDYNWKIAKKRFENIFKEVAQYQEINKCDTCLLCIGNDFFNYDTITGTTTKGTPQANDLTYRTMFKLGLEMYTRAIKTLSQIFNKVEVRLQSGNHDKISCFHLYMALECAFKNYKNIKFSNNYKDVQCFEWGDCAIFFTHGREVKIKQLIASIPNEFAKEWGEHKYRELHTGHLHHEQLYKGENGLKLRQVSAPCGTDNWHYENRFINDPEYQIYIWDKNKGLTDIRYLTFEEE